MSPLDDLERVIADVQILRIEIDQYAAERAVAAADPSGSGDVADGQYRQIHERIDLRLDRIDAVLYFLRSPAQVSEMVPGTAMCCEPEDENLPGPGRAAKWAVRRPGEHVVVPYAGERFARRNAGPGYQVLHRCSPDQQWQVVSYHRIGQNQSR